MKTIALRFSDNYDTPDGIIAEHRKCISEKGYVWFGKIGSPVSDKVYKSLIVNKTSRILLIHSDQALRYWAYIDKVVKETPPLTEIPEYYRERINAIHVWFRVIRIEETDKNVMLYSKVISSGASLAMVSKRSMKAYFIIEYLDNDDE